MLVKLQRELSPIAGGWRSRSPVLHLSAHGRSPEIADRNLERAARLYLAGFERQGTLRRELTALGLEVVQAVGDGVTDDTAAVQAGAVGALRVEVER